MTRPEHALHVGTVECAALLIDPQLIGEAVARARVLSLWGPGSLVQQTTRGFLLRSQRPAFTAVTRAPGLPLVERRLAHGTVLTAAPLSDAQLEALAPAAGSLVMSEAGALTVHAPPFETVDVAAWLSLDDFEVALVTPMGRRPAPPKAPAGVEKTTRALLVPNAPAAPRDVAAIRDALAEPAAGVRRAGLLALLGSLVQSWLAKQRETDPSRQNAIGRAMARVEQWLARALMRVGLSTWLARRHAEYLDRLFEMFDRGDIEAALHHAIPLGGQAGDASSPMLRLPGPREKLEIARRSVTASSSINLANDLYGELRKRYRKAFVKLDAEGRIHEAAFVLAELLHDVEEAVAFLERRGELSKAAELADSRKLAPGLVVRQWFLAGNRARAIQVARRAGGYADAVARLERARQQEEANSLRLVWADQLANQGDYANAVDVSAAVDSARELRARWVELAIESGGATGARMLAYRVSQGLGDAADSRALVWALLAEQGPEGRRRRRVFAQKLVVGRPAGGETVALAARAAARALFADADDGAGDPELSLVTAAMVKLADDDALRVDIPRWPEPRGSETREHRFAVDERGTGPVATAVLLAHGRTAVALGEAGVALVDRNGKRIAHFDQPASHLVISDHGDRAITIIRRGSVARLGRVDFITRRSQAWCEVELGVVASDFDGSSWLVTAPAADGQGDLLSIDATMDDFSALHRVGGVGQQVHSLVRGPERCELIAGSSARELDGFSFQLPGWTLRGRAQLAPPGDEGLGAPIWRASPDGAYLAVCDIESSDGDAGVVASLRGEARAVSNHPVFAANARVVDAAIGRDVFAVAASAPEGVMVVIIRRSDLMPVAEITLAGSRRAGLRLQADSLVVTCDLGRVVAVDVHSGELGRALLI